MEESRDRLVEGHMALVEKIALKLKRQFSLSLGMDDLRAYGAQGLVEAADRFDPSRGASFSTFAYYRIRGAILDGLRTSGWYSRGDYSRYRAEERVNEYMKNLAERGIEPNSPQAPTNEQILEDIACALDGIATIHIASLGEESELPDAHSPDAEQILVQKETKNKVRLAVANLPEKERRLMELYYYGDKNLEEAGQSLGLSKSWVCRLHARAVNLLRDSLAGGAE